MGLEYRATFGIDCGLSHGFGLKESHYETQEEVVIADDDISAIQKVAGRAIHFSRDYLSNPDTEYTTVTLLKLCGHERDLINQREVLTKAGFGGVQRFEWDGDKLVTKCHMLEHLLLIHGSESAPKSESKATAQS